MTPKQEAEDLIQQYMKITQWKMGLSIVYVIEQAKQCAIIAVDRIITTLTNLWGCVKETIYWKQVKTEIENYECSTMVS